ncbi:hypothetical protein C6P40_001301 [Pichia californica]|uniref:Uncharacterized protein n=1 Tax=Pichia californica TaxID=460514 RepID=A0A9P7BGE1_9ASCO|nr:hypothetical protein C6P42_005426 [[Candida] californica]KAG0688188.1 hypothetical protein C6P40_001301 [[Candida] californica]
MQKRQPLASKSTNLQRSRSTSPLKRSQSPTKNSIYSSSPTKKNRISPIKNLPQLNHPLSSSSSLSSSSFTIFQDKSYNRHNNNSINNNNNSPKTKSIIPIFENTQISSNKENEFIDNNDSTTVRKIEINNKENPSLLNNTHNTHTQIKRLPLSDLNINQYPGYIHIGPHQPLSQLQQLNEPWSTNTFSNLDLNLNLNSNSNSNSNNKFNHNKRILVPSYITPPKRNRVHLYKYISSTTSNQSKNLLPKLKSIDDSYQPSSIDSFYVYNEKIDTLK